MNGFVLYYSQEKVTVKHISIPYSKQNILSTVNCLLFNLNFALDWLTLLSTGVMVNVAVLLIISGTPSYVYVSAAVMVLITCSIRNRLQIDCQCIMSGLVCRAQRHNIWKLEINKKSSAPVGSFVGFRWSDALYHRHLITAS